MKKIILLLILLSLSLSSCEKDDICDATTATTPKLILEFYDTLHPTVLKNVTNLAVKEVGITSAVISFNSVSKIQLPLKTNEDSTKYSFVLNAGNTNTSLIYTDILQFNYSRKTVFVSRACGYKTLFDLNNDVSLPNPYILNNTPAASQGIWIKNITVEKYNLETENETHIKIYF
jgi:hypothetical protein